MALKNMDEANTVFKPSIFAEEQLADDIPATNRIGAVTGSHGVGLELLITIKDDTISDRDLKELIGLFHRYNFDKKQLGQFIKLKLYSNFTAYKTLPPGNSIFR